MDSDFAMSVFRATCALNLHIATELACQCIYSNGDLLLILPVVVSEIINKTNT